MPKITNETFPSSDTFSSLNELTKWLEKNGEKGRGWWRGQPDAFYKLVPGIFRDEEDRKQEIAKINLFKLMAPSRHKGCPSRYYHWIFLMQHYRLHTRVLDWTLSPLIAMFFAVSNFNEKESNKYGALWYLEPARLATKHFNKYRGMVFAPETEEIKHLYTCGLPNQGPYLDKVAPIMPTQTDLRMLVQLSRFTLHGSFNPLEASVGFQENILKTFLIPPHRKEPIKKQLAYLGISESNLFPNLESLAHDINFRTFEAF